MMDKILNTIQELIGNIDFESHKQFIAENLSSVTNINLKDASENFANQPDIYIPAIIVTLVTAWVFVSVSKKILGFSIFAAAFIIAIYSLAPNIIS